MQISNGIHRVFQLSHIMRKPAYAIGEHQRRRSACASAQSDQRLCCSLHRSYNSSNFYIQYFKPLPSFCGCAGRFESTLFANPEDRFSCDEAPLSLSLRRIIPVSTVICDYLKTCNYPFWILNFNMIGLQSILMNKPRQYDWIDFIIYIYYVSWNIVWWNIVWYYLANRSWRWLQL